MIDYVIFEKRSDGELPAWTTELVKEFCEDQKYEIATLEDSPVFIVAKLISATEDGEKNYRHVELTPTVSFLIQDDPSLDDFLQPEIPEIEIPKDHPMTFARREAVCIERIEESKEEEPFYYA